jgi:replicative DNA helicase
MIDQVKIFPYAEEVELQVLGTILQWPEYFDMVQDIFHSDLFYQDDKKSISNAIISAKSKSIKPDTIAVMQELKKANRLAEVGGISFLSSLSNKVSSATNLEHNCRILHQYAILRKIIVDAATISQKAFDPRHDAFDLI